MEGILSRALIAIRCTIALAEEGGLTLRAEICTKGMAGCGKSHILLSKVRSNLLLSIPYNQKKFKKETFIHMKLEGSIILIFTFSEIKPCFQNYKLMNI